MIVIECGSCTVELGQEDTLARARARARARAHRCAGRPYPLRVPAAAVLQGDAKVEQTLEQDVVEEPDDVHTGLRCLADDCVATRYCRGLCVKHHARWKGGDDLPALEAFAARAGAWEQLHEDVEWLAAAGTPREEIARRVGVSWDRIVTQYRRHGATLRPYLLASAS